MTILTIFLIALIAAFAVVALIIEPSKTDKAVHARLAALDRSGLSAEDGAPGIMKATTFSTIPALDRFLRTNEVAIWLHTLINQADVNWTVGQVVIVSLVLVCVGALLGNWWVMGGIVGWLPGLALGTVPFLFLMQKRKLRVRRFSEQLPQAIDLMTRGLRAGQALPAAIETVANESDEPLSSEFRRAADEQSFGLPFREAMLNMGRRMPVPDLQFLITAILVQKETGGNLAQILDKTSQVLRERIRIIGQMRIRTAQGRLTGGILTGLPFVIFFGLNILQPGYGKVLFETPTGQKMVTYAAILMAIGILMIRRIVNVKF
ncbi:MAG TPA: type II secretion system F family protein [Candidatus Limnocylindrales bacterium]|nr:type II secretion system F family protein [Candidatus Limnocylindrales bacterium]